MTMIGTDFRGVKLFSARAVSRQIVLLSAAAISALVLACSSGEDPTATPPATPTPHPLAGGVLATFDVTGQEFKVWVTNEQAIEALFALQAGTSSANIPNGLVQTGAGQAGHNGPYSWHMDPEDIEMVELTIELCDGSPDYIEENLTDWMASVERYCPWGAELVTLVDHRQ
jgi:hypothetical protein